MRVLRTLAAPPLSSHNYLALTADGLLVGAGDQGQVAFDLASGKRRWRVDLSAKADDCPCPGFAVAEDMGRVLLRQLPGATSRSVTSAPGS